MRIVFRRLLARPVPSRPLACPIAASRPVSAHRADG